jgi:hypothetical protein
MGRRTRIGEGVYQDAYGLAATVKVRGVQRERRFPLGTPLDHVQSWRIQMRAVLDADRPARPRSPLGTLERDGERWITRKAGLPSYAADHSHLRAWYPRFGHTLASGIRSAVRSAGKPSNR